MEEEEEVVFDLNKLPFLLTLIFGVATLMTNLLLIVVYIINRQVREKLTVFVVNIAAADFLKGILLIMLWLDAKNRMEFEHSRSYELTITAQFGALFAHLLVSVVRFLAIKKLPLYTKLVASRWRRGLFSIGWILAFLVGFAPRLLGLDMEIHTEQYHIYSWMYLVIILGVVMLTLALYAVILLGDNYRVSELVKHNKRAAVTGRLAFIIFAVFWVPSAPLKLFWYRMDPQTIKSLYLHLEISQVQPVVNPLIFMLWEKDTKRHVMSSLCCCFTFPFVAEETSTREDALSPGTADVTARGGTVSPGTDFITTRGGIHPGTEEMTVPPAPVLATNMGVREEDTLPPPPSYQSVVDQDRNQLNDNIYFSGIVPQIGQCPPQMEHYQAQMELYHPPIEQNQTQRGQNLPPIVRNVIGSLNRVVRF